MSEIAFRPLREDDLPQLHEWLQREHVRRWWGWEVGDLERTRAHYLPAIRGEEPTDLYVLVVDGRDVGMLQTYLAVDYPEWEAVVQVGPGVSGVDVMIGEEELVGLGLGPRVLAAFVRDCVRGDAAVATVEEGNRRSWRAFEKAGFAHVRDVLEDGKPHRLLRFDRPRQSRRRGGAPTGPRARPARGDGNR
ncbi:MAG TPA: GNAT family N-acetyltransferase [Gaiellaceae bacterium]|nr:GNAT family N-acetyltransferase [Gaiellaceae bacterium]